MLRSGLSDEVLTCDLVCRLFPGLSIGVQALNSVIVTELGALLHDHFANIVLGRTTPSGLYSIQSAYMISNALQNRRSADSIGWRWQVPVLILKRYLINVYEFERNGS